MTFTFDQKCSLWQMRNGITEPIFSENFIKIHAKILVEVMVTTHSNKNTNNSCYFWPWPLTCSDLQWSKIICLEPYKREINDKISLSWLGSMMILTFDLHFLSWPSKIREDQLHHNIKVSWKFRWNLSIISW